MRTAFLLYDTAVISRGKVCAGNEHCLTRTVPPGQVDGKVRMTNVETARMSDAHDDDSFEDVVARFYDEGPRGDGAGRIYSELMDDVWFHGDPDLEKAGATPRQAAVGTLRRLATEVKIQPGDRVLDFGSGPGGGAVELAAMTGATCVGLSSTETLNRRARSAAAARGMEGQVSFLTVGPRDYRTLSAFSDGDFQTAIAFESICHLPRPDLLFAALHRVVRPGGWLIVRDWAARPWGKHQSPEQINRILDPVCKYIRLAELRSLDRHVELVETAGFKILRSVDVFAEVKCWGATPPEDRAKWLGYTGKKKNLFRKAKKVLDDAREAGVFTVVELLAQRV